MGLNSTSTIKIIDLLCEGTIEGVVGGDKGVYLNETPIKADNGSNNFDTESVSWDFRLGTATQGKLHGYSDDGTSTLTNINSEIGSNYSETLNANNLVSSRDYGAGRVIRQITDTDVESFQILFSIPSLFCSAREGLAKGQLFNASIRLKIYIKSQGTGYGSPIWDRTVTGISTSDYQIKTPLIQLPGTGPWDIRVDKVTNNENDFEVKYTSFTDVDENTPLETHRGNRVFWTSLIEKQELKSAYPYTACVGLSLSTKQFNALPTRAYLVKGIKCGVPHNCDVREDGSLDFIDGLAFDGSLHTRWTTCPVSIFYAMCTNKVWGAGNFISEANLNWVDLYSLCQYANQLVTTPDGTQEPRFAINTLIGSQNDAYSVLRDLASAFRGMTYWASNAIQVTADHGNLDGSDIDPVHLYNNSNVIGGVFTYTGTSLKTRSTSIRVKYNDPDNFYKHNFLVVEDYDLITKYGYQVKEVVAFGCTSKWQAQRLGRWLMAVEEIDQEVVSFSTGLEGVAVFPGQVFAIADEMRQGVRLAGRVSSATSSAITCDQTISLPAGDDHKITCRLPDGTVETKLINSVADSVVNCDTFSAAPQTQSVWSISANLVTEQKFRCLSVDEKGDGTYTITATEFNDSIYATADAGVALEFEDTTTFNDPPAPVTGLNWAFSEIRINNNTVNRIAWSWSRATDPNTIGFELRYKVGNGSYTTITTTNNVFNIDSLASGTSLTFEVRGVGPAPLNKTSPWTSQTIVVPTPVVVLPPDPTNVSIQASSNDEVTFRWSIPTWGGNNSDLTSIVRHSSKTDGTGTWANSTLLREVQTNTDSVVLPIIEGEYMVKFKDNRGNKSANEGSAVIDLPDNIPRLNQTVRREDTDTPPFQGQRDNVIYSAQYDALALDGTAYWDEQTGNIDDWASIDFLGNRESAGTYFFKDVVDLGGKFTVVFKRKLEMRGLIPNDMIDNRVANIDTWTDFDGTIPDETSADLYFRKSDTTPAPTDAVLTEDGDKILYEDGDDVLQESSQAYGAWTKMETGRYTGRVFQFKVDLSSTAADQTPLIDELGYTLQLDARTASASMSSGAGAKAVTYAQAFYQTPKLGITANNLATGDYYEISNESRTGFTVHFKNSSGSSQDRTFAYSANGYGAEEP
jgi:predicted phage tail protein